MRQTRCAVRIAVLGVLSLTTGNTMAVPITGVVNGSFETTAPPVWDYWGADTYSAAASWIRLGFEDGAGSLSTGLETLSATDGARLLRLATDGGRDNARVAQMLGTMAAGETYTFTGDVMASTLYGPYHATAAFVNEAVAAPATVYARQTVDLARGTTGAFNLSYTATGADDGQDLCIWLQAETDPQGYTRGGIDNVHLVVLPPNSPPAVPTGPSPADGAVDVAVASSLGWASAPGATGYQVSLWALGGTTNTSDVNAPGWSPGSLQALTTYQWQVVATNQYGSATGAVWTFVTSLIPYTYIYEPDSIPPNSPTEAAAPSILNDGLIGVGWDGATMLYGSWPVFPVAKMPYITLTLAPHAGLGKLTVWYARAIEAGIAEPGSLTVSDDFGHSATTVFATPPGNGTFMQDVALTGIQGTVLHLNFVGVREWVGLDEVRVFSPVPEPPAVPTGPSPSDGNVSVPVTNSLAWNASVGADGYDVYFWIPPVERPLTPTASVTANSWMPIGILPFQTDYNWQVVATNAYGSATGAVWTFTTSPFPYTYVYDDVSARPENYGAQDQVETQYGGRLLNDGITGGWGVLYYGRDYLGNNPAAFWPAITITLAQEPIYEYLRIWHYGGNHDAGVYGPSSLTVSDDFNHTITFSGFPDVETSTDVPITGMRGTRLHLRFSPNGEIVGLSEIKVNAKPLVRQGTVLVVR